MDLPNLWAITSPALNDIISIARRGDDELSKVALRQAMLTKQAQAGRGAAAAKGKGRLGYIPILGSISQRASWWSNTSSMEIVAAVESMSHDPSVSSIILDIDSPGGTVAGTQEASDAIFAARQRKPIIAIANSLAASAAYWIGSAASKFYVAPSGEVGSIGVYSMHLDVSEMNKKAGIRPTYISAGKYKVEGNPHEPLSAEAKESVQASVNSAYVDFLKAVARNRGVKASEVKSGFGEGRTVGSKEAVRLGMVDGVQSFAAVVNIARNIGTMAASRQAADLADRRARWAAAQGKISTTSTDSTVAGYLAAEPPAHRTRLMFLYQSWSAFNAAYFGGRLTQAKITVADLTKQRALANCSMTEKPATIRFDVKFIHTATHETLADVLIHEMIHQALGQLYPRQSRDAKGNPHHEEFATIANRIAQQRGWPDVSEGITKGKAAAQYWPPRRRQYETTQGS